MTRDTVIVRQGKGRKDRVILIFVRMGGPMDPG